MNQVSEKGADTSKESLLSTHDQEHHKGRKDKTQKERLEKSNKSQEKGREKLEKDRLQHEKVEKERLAKIEQERIEKEAAEKERIERLQNEKIDKSKEKKKRKDVSKDFSTDLLVVPQRQAAKKASENMMRTQITGLSKKEQSKDEEKKELSKEFNKNKDRENSSKDSGPIKENTIKQKSKTSKVNKTMTLSELTSPLSEPVKEKETKSKKAEKLDKDIIVAYVPQRQAAKKAAEHIKGLGKIVTTDVSAATIPEDKQDKLLSGVSAPQSTKSLPSSVLSKSNSMHYYASYYFSIFNFQSFSELYFEFLQFRLHQSCQAHPRLVLAQAPLVVVAVHRHHQAIRTMIQKERKKFRPFLTRCRNHRVLPLLMNRPVVIPIQVNQVPMTKQIVMSVEKMQPLCRQNPSKYGTFC